MCYAKENLQRSTKSKKFIGANSLFWGANLALDDNEITAN